MSRSKPMVPHPNLHLIAAVITTTRSFVESEFSCPVYVFTLVVTVGGALAVTLGRVLAVTVGNAVGDRIGELVGTISDDHTS